MSREFAGSGNGPVSRRLTVSFLFITIACGALSGFHAHLLGHDRCWRRGQMRVIVRDRVLRRRRFAAILDGTILHPQRAVPAYPTTAQPPPPYLNG